MDKIYKTIKITGNNGNERCTAFFDQKQFKPIVVWMKKHKQKEVILTLYDMKEIQARIIK